MGLKGFLIPSHFIDGGVTGISILLSHVTHLNIAVLLMFINVPFLILSYRRIGRLFAIKSAFSIAGLALVLYFVPFPDITPDKLLTAVFGGFFIGAGVGLSIRGGAVLDGTEIAALLISRDSHLVKVGDVILILNVFIFGAAAFLLGIEPALYSILTYFSATKVMDFILYGIEGYSAVSIISEKSDEIRNAVMSELNIGVTMYHGSSGRNRTELEIVYCVVNRLEIGSIKALARQIDPSAFVLVHPLSDADGGIVKKKMLHNQSPEVG
ncbi:MAG: YitT family protein [Bacteroidota bacterium]